MTTRTRYWTDKFCPPHVLEQHPLEHEVSVTVEQVLARLMSDMGSMRFVAEQMEANPELTDEQRGMLAGFHTGANMIQKVIDDAYAEAKHAAAEQAKCNAAREQHQQRMDALQQKADAIGGEICGRCGGAGGWKGWPGYYCYDCNGEGVVRKD